MEGKVTASSPIRLVYILLFAQFVVQLISFLYLYVNVAQLEHQVHQAVGCSIASSKDPSVVRRKRSSVLPIADDNAVSEIYRVSFEIMIFFNLFQNYCFQNTI